MSEYPDYSKCIVNFSNSILSHFDVPVLHPTLPEVDEILRKEYKNVVVILLDGLGSDVLCSTLPEDAFLRKNLRFTYSSVFPPTTTAAKTSFESSLYPIEHGWLGWSVFFKQEEKIVDCLTNTLKDSKEPASIFYVADYYLPYESIYDKLKKTGKVQVNQVYSIGRNSFPNFDNWCRRIKKLCETKWDTFTFAYWDDPDKILHKKGINSKEVKKMVQDMNDKLEKMCSSLENTAVFITADHGHTAVSNYLLSDYPSIVNMLKYPTSIEPRCTSFFVKDEYKKDFPQEFNKFFGKDFELLTYDEVIDKQIFGFGEKNPGLTGIGDFVAVAFGDKTLLWDKKSKQFVSHHGGATKAEIEIPMIVVEKTFSKRRH